ncbi:MAG: hypothetical protein R2865_10555 [Deinococcales bacterium]
MMWDDSPYFGFSSQRPWRAFSSDDASLSLAAQIAQEDSVFHHYQKLIALRHQEPALVQGRLELIESPKNLAHL